ncbi:MAG: TIR domain-containing protein [Candidatus Tectimicrobiota bacterium]
MAPPVFISHSSLDKATAETVCTYLEAQGVACWIAPRNVPPGGKYGEVIIQALEGALAVILIFSEHSNASEQVMNEIERAVSKQKPIFPLKITATTPSGELEYFISRRHWLDATLSPLETLLPQLLDALSHLTAHHALGASSGGDASPQSPVSSPRQPERSTPTLTRPSPAPSRRTSWLVGAGLLVLLTLGGLLWFGQDRRRTPGPEHASLPGLVPGSAQAPSPLASALLVTADAYHALEQGDSAKAGELFQSLTAQSEAQIQAQGYAGLAALALAREAMPQALEHATQAESLDPEVIYSHVVRGHLLWQQGKIAEATAAYRTATEKTRGLPWQQTVAYNRLGRIYAAQGDVQQALTHYDQAVSKPAVQGHPDIAAAYTNKGHALASVGKWPEALASYRQAQELNPADRLTTILLQEAERREQATQDRDKQERIDHLVTSLMQAYKDGKPMAEPGDGWTSRPLTLAFLRLQTQGTPASRAGEDEALLLRLMDALQSTERLLVLERDMLDKVLAELRLSASELTDPQTAVRVGRILSARLLATGSLTRRGSDVQLTVRVVETETTRLRAALTETLNAERGLDGLAEHIATLLLHKLHTAYPIQGRLLQATPQQVVLNIGSEHGVTPGMTLQVLQDVPLQVGGKIAGMQLLNVGQVEVLSVEPKLAHGRVVEASAWFEAGWKVKER